MRATVVLLLTAAAGILPVLQPASAAPHPVKPSMTQLSISGIDRAAESAAPALPPVAGRSATGSATVREGVAAPGAPTTVVHTGLMSTTDYRLVGLTWKGARPDVTGWVRVRSGGTWSSWYQLPADDGHGPDPSAAEAKNVRGGTDPLLVAPSDGVQVRVDGVGAAPSDLRVDLVQPGTSAADSHVGDQPAASAQAAASRPTIYTRKQWGADESLRKGTPSYGVVRAGFVHHTVDANNYSSSDVPAILRSIYAFHVLGRGWNDIGYNFLVDRFGRVWEGRYGGVDKAVVGAHTRGYNSVAFAMSAIGTYSTTAPSSAMVSAYQRLFAWKLGLSGVDPLGSTFLVDKTFRNISGHRDAGQTECPGQLLYNQLPTIRSGARSLQGAMLYQPKASTSGWAYGSGGSVTATATVPKTQGWSLTITQACHGYVRKVTGSASTSTPVSARWDGRDDAGDLVPPGVYDLTLASSSSTSSATPFRFRVTIGETASSPPSWCPPRLGGSNRYDVSVAAARATDDSTTKVVLVSGEQRAAGDALVAAPLARHQGAVLLLTQTDQLSAPVLAELRRRGVTSVTIVGGPGSVSAAVQSAVESLGASVTRIGGATRFDVAAGVARAIAGGGSAPDVMLASGAPTAIADGLGLSGPAAQLGRPILLLTADTVPAATKTALQDLQARTSLVAGGPASVSDAVLSQLPSPTRIGGASRFDVAAGVATWAASQHLDVSRTVVSSGVTAALADTLSGGQLGLPMVYVVPTGVPTPSLRFLRRSDVHSVLVMGGTASVPDPVAGRAKLEAGG